MRPLSRLHGSLAIECLKQAQKYQDGIDMRNIDMLIQILLPEYRDPNPREYLGILDFLQSQLAEQEKSHLRDITQHILMFPEGIRHRRRQEITSISHRPRQGPLPGMNR